MPENIYRHDRKMNLRMKSVRAHKCWICGGSQLEEIKPSNLSDRLTSRSFAITASDFGVTAAIDCCRTCGFLQCSNIQDVLPFYEELEDQCYEEGRRQRGLQQRALLNRLNRFKNAGRLLDIGAGSGMLVEHAL
ncbi:MAG: hypothetical protein ABIK28_16170, partial [Planctomycetota bacterium]